MNNSICHSNFVVLSIAQWMKNPFLRTHRTKPPLLLLGTIVIGLLQAAPLVLTHAQAATSITQSTGAGDLGTNVTPSGNVYGITGGRSVDTNLFHSFSQFSVGTGDIAQFQTTTLVPNTTLSNILGRVTGGSPSSIFGTVDSITYYPNANLFLMNPNGILFGPGAQTSVGGMAHFTTADYLRLTDNIRFEAVPGAQDALLSTASVAAFGFLGSNPAAIAVQGSQLTVANGTGLSLVGGNRGFTYTDPDTGATASVPDGVTMTGGRLSAPDGQISLASVASAGEVVNGTLEPAPNINGNSFAAMGNISLSQGATLNVSGEAAGTVRIRGGQFVIADATISADTVNSNGALTALDIKLTGDLLISDTRGLPSMTARTTGDGDAGAIQINSANLVATSTSSGSPPFALVDTHTSGAGRAGNINITTGNLQASYQGPDIVQFTDSGTAGPGHGGDVTISAQTVTLEGIGINTGDSMATLLGQFDASGSAGNVTIKGNGTINADSIMLLNSTIDTSALLAFDSAEQSGSVTLNASEINLTSSVVSALGFGGGGAFSVTADRFIMERGTQLESLTASGTGGGILVNARIVALLDGSTMATTIVGDGQAGDIHVMATDHLTLSTSPFDTNPSGFFSNSTGDLGGGDAGAIVVTTPRLDMTGGSRINTATLSSGHGGDVTINSTNSVSISGEFPSSDPEPIF
ncbi:MAG: filamentous hemagglutinin N-terminal domain-containing protein [Nitrospiraceae bacterium]